MHKLSQLAGAFGLCTLAALPSASIAEGQALFEKSCVACHSAGGAGTPGLAPPINITAFWQGLGETTAPAYLSGVIMSGLTGKLTVEGVNYIALAMPPLQLLSDQDVSEITEYMLKTFGEMDVNYSPEDVAALRATSPTHATLREMRQGD